MVVQRFFEGDLGMYRWAPAWWEVAMEKVFDNPNYLNFLNYLEFYLSVQPLRLRSAGARRSGGERCQCELTSTLGPSFRKVGGALE